MAPPATLERRRTGTIRCGGRQLRLDELHERAARGASGLAALGVGAGDAVALLLRNDTSFLEVLLAANLAGASAVPINWHYKNEEIAHVLADSSATHLVVHADLMRGLRDDVSSGLVRIAVATPPAVQEAYGIAAAQCGVPADVIAWEALVEGHPPWRDGGGRGSGTIFYTSGTTGRPKGVRRKPLPDERRRAFARLVQEWFGARPGMRAAVTGPLYHSGQISYATAVIHAQGDLSVVPRFDAEALLRLVEAERLTHLHLVPVMMLRLVQLPEAVRTRYDVSSLEFVVHGAAPCPPHVKRALIDWWGPVLHEYYAATEAGMVTRTSSDEWLARPGTVGKPLPGRIVRIYDEEGNVLPPYSEGEVYMSLGLVPDFTYAGAHAERAAVERDGLVTSGDVGYLDEEGYLYLCDRKGDMLITGGVNVYPAEIEAVLASHPAVHDCAVFGIPDEEFGEAVAAVVQRRDRAKVGADELAELVRRRLASYKAPRLIEFVDELPRDDSGKIAKRSLREPYWSSAGRSL